MNQDIGNIIKLIVILSYLSHILISIKYIKHPVKRLTAKYIYAIPEKSYETGLHELYEDQCKLKMKLD